MYFYIYSLKKTKATQPLNQDQRTGIKGTSDLTKDAPIPKSPSVHTLKSPRDKEGIERQVLAWTSPPVAPLGWALTSSSQKWGDNR